MKNKPMENISLKVGDILYDSWGYSMTIVDYYQVVKVTPKGAVLRAISTQVVDDSGPGGGHVMPVKDAFVSHRDLGIVDCRIQVRARKSGGQYMVGRLWNGCQHLDGHYVYLWDGRPRYFNHWD